MNKYYVYYHYKPDSDKAKNRPPRSKETRKKMSDKLKGRIISEEHRKKIGDGNRGKIMSKENRKRMSIVQMGNQNARKYY